MRRLRPPSNNTCAPERQYQFNFDQPGVGYSTAFEDDKGLVMQYALDDSKLNSQLGAMLPARIADLIDIAAAVYISDRRAVRCTRGPVPTWRRSIGLTIPVRCREFWDRPTVGDTLTGVLQHLTEDDWRVRFCERRAASVRLAESQHHLFPQPFDGPVHVSLLSGGLDSFAGIAAAIALNPLAHYVCVSGVANHRQEERQRHEMRFLRQLKPASLTHVRVPCWLHHAEEVPQEPTRRTRGFLFLALGAVAALAAGTDRLWLFENGVGALNLSFTRAEPGVMTTRAVHPRTLNLMGAFISLIADKEFTIANEAVFSTKAQMCAAPAIQPVIGGIPVTFSCDGFPLRRQGPTQCGVCTSCLLRRLALFNAGVAEDAGSAYRYDVQSSQPLDERHSRGFREMDWQVARLTDALRREDPWMGLVDEFPRIVEAQEALSEQHGLPVSTVAERLVSLYRCHCEEWRRFGRVAHPLIQRIIQRKAA
jgi:7-cyano-7-deazaguanine synthase in queuosine biosynthesis